MPETQDLSSLRAALDAANRRISEESAARRQVEGQLRTETGNRFAAQETAVDTAIGQAESAAGIAKQKWVSLQQEGNFEGASEAMAEMISAQGRLTQLQSQKTWLDQQKQQAAATPADPLVHLRPEEREWVNKNPQYVNDPAFKEKVDAAAMHASKILGIPERSPQWFEQIEKTVYPERFSQGGNPDTGTGEPQDDDYLGDNNDTGSSVALEQQHNMNAPVLSISTDAPAMRLDARVEEPQARAVGRGGGGIAAVAAPPTRRIVAASNRVANGGQIQPTMEEVAVAHALYDSIEPNAQDRSDETVVRWYHALYNDKSHRLTKRRSWAVHGGRAA